MNLVFYKQIRDNKFHLATVLQGLNRNSVPRFIPYDKTMLQNLNLLVFHFLFHLLKRIVTTNEP